MLTPDVCVCENVWVGFWPDCRCVTSSYLFASASHVGGGCSECRAPAPSVLEFTTSRIRGNHGKVPFCPTYHHSLLCLEASFNSPFSATRYLALLETSKDPIVQWLQGRSRRANRWRGYRLSTGGDVKVIEFWELESTTFRASIAAYAKSLVCTRSGPLPSSSLAGAQLFKHCPITCQALRWTPFSVLLSARELRGYPIDAPKVPVRKISLNRDWLSSFLKEV
jgi:hypothetical protein